MAIPLRNTSFVQDLVSVLNANESNRKLAGLPHGTLRGKVTSVDDPLNRGRVRVIFDDMNPDIPQITGAGEDVSGRRVGDEPDASHWIDVSPAFSGKQPPGLVGKRVNICASGGQYQYAVLQDVLFDPEVHATDAKDTPVMPNNSSMTRMPIYPAGKLPQAAAENHGCSVIEEGGPMNSDWLCICLKRNGKFIWVRHSDLAHGHAGGNDITSQVDSSGNRPSPGQVASVWDQVFPTSGGELAKFTGYGTMPRGNPWGDAAAWAPPPMADLIKNPELNPLPVQAGTLFNQIDALSQVRLPGFINDIAGALITEYAPSISEAVSSIPGLNIAGQAIEKAQKLLSIAETAKQIINNPIAFVKDTALGAIKAYTPQATEAVLSSITNTTATITPEIPTLPLPPDPLA